MNFDLTKIINPIFFQILGTVILLAVIAKFTYKSYLQMLDKREAHINDNINQANIANQEAQAKLEDVTQQQQSMIQEKEAIISQAKQLGDDLKNGIVEDARQEAQQIIDKANNEAQSSFNQVQDEVMSNVYDYVALVSRNYIASNLDDAKEKELINQAISKVKYE